VDEEAATVIAIQFQKNKKDISEELSSSSQPALVAVEQLLSTYSQKPLASAPPLVGNTSAKHL
jgi:hypothetical protein